VPEKNLSQCHIFHHKRFYQTAVLLELITNCCYKKVIRTELVNIQIGGQYIILYATEFSAMCVWYDLNYTYSPLFIYTLPIPRKIRSGWPTETKHDPYGMLLMQICSSATTSKHTLPTPLVREVLTGTFPQFIVIRCDRYVTAEL